MAFEGAIYKSLALKLKEDEFPCCQNTKER
jgi:hypothetical protein